MPSDHLEVLLQDLEECSDELQKRHDDLQQLVEHDNFRQSRWSVLGIAGGCNKYADDLRRSCSSLGKKNKTEDDKRHRQVIDGLLKSVSWIKDLNLHIKEQIVDNSSKTITEQDSIAVVVEIERDLSAIERVIKMVTELDQLFKPGQDAANEDRKKIMNDSLAEINDQTKIFERRITTLAPTDRRDSFTVLRGQRGCSNFEKLDWFWSHIGLPAGMWWAEDPSNRFDGVLITRAHIEKAARTLKMFRDAWITVNGHESVRDPDSLDLLPKMPKVACVLHACRRHELFNIFVEEEITDSKLDAGWDAFEGRVELAFRSHSLPGARELARQFSRVKQRPWLEGTTLKLELSEPVPLRHKKYLRAPRGHVEVSSVEDSWSDNKLYALKVVKTETADDGQRADLLNEIRQLMSLSQKDHGHHIVKCVKTYERGPKREEIGLLLTPVANLDLDKFLKKCCGDERFRRKQRAQLLRACGCLSYSLAYLHNIERMRHRDVKPHNILWIEPHENQSSEFLWADFGLAFVFRDKGFSGDLNPNFGATPEYEAPEVDHKQPGLHTRASDIFALGCVFLEIVCVLSMPERDQTHDIPLRDLFWEYNAKRFYKHHLKGLGAWIDSTEAKLKKSDDKILRKALQRARDMIKEEAESRPKAGKIVLELWSVKANEGNTKPFFCSRCEEKMRVDTGRNPKHPGIFKHERGSRLSLGTSIVRPRSLMVGDP